MSVVKSMGGGPGITLRVLFGDRGDKQHGEDILEDWRVDRMRARSMI